MGGRRTPLYVKATTANKMEPPEIISSFWRHTSSKHSLYERYKSQTATVRTKMSFSQKYNNIFL